MLFSFRTGLFSTRCVVLFVGAPSLASRAVLLCWKVGVDGDFHDSFPAIAPSYAFNKVVNESSRFKDCS